MQSIQVQDLGRVQAIAAVAAKNGFGHILHSLGWADQIPAADESAKTAPYARRLRQLLTDLGPTFVKFGQVLSVRPDILPADVLKEFQSLQDRVPALGFDQVRKVVENELAHPLEEVFDEFDPVPIGSASIAQVHRARLAGGPEVAVKLQRPDIERTIRSDLHILYTLAQLAEGRLALPGLYTPTAIVREFDAAITLELDFLQELNAAQRMRRNFEEVDDVVIPKVFPRWSTRRLLVMELIEGRRLSRFMEDFDREEGRRVAHQLMNAEWLQVFEHGFFHGDPHPGNILITDDGKLGFLDFGITGMLTGAAQDMLITVFTALVFRDAESLAMAVYRAGASHGRVDLRTLREELDRLMVKYYGASLEEMATPVTVMEIVRVAARFRINLPAEYAVLSRVAALIEGECQQLLPDIDIVEEVKPYANRLVRKRFGPERVLNDAGRLIIQMQGHMRDLPTQVSQVLMDLDAGRLSFNFRNPDDVKLREEIRMGVQRLSLAALAATTSLGALLFLAAWSPQPWGVPLFGIGGLVLLGIGLAIFGALGIHVLFARLLSFDFWRRRLLAVLRFFRWRRS